MSLIPNQLLPKEWQNILNQTDNAILEKALINIYKQMDPEKREQMNKVFTSGTEEEKENFLKLNFPDLPNEIMKEIKKVTEK